MSIQAQKARPKTILQSPDLTISNLSAPASGEQGALVSFTFNLNNIGNAPVVGEYRVVAYLSTDPTWDTGDVEVGYINTGNTAQGTIPNITGVLLIHDDVPGPGLYYLIVVADAEDQIEELNETNNTSSIPFEVTAIPFEGECGFIHTYGLYPDLTSSALPKIEETNSGYTLTFEEISADQTTIREVEVQLNLAGEQLAFSDNISIYDPPFDSCALFTSIIGMDQLLVQKLLNGINLAWSNTYTLNTPSPISMLLSPTAMPIIDGVLVAGIYMDLDMQFVPFLLKLDSDGNLMGENYLQEFSMLPTIELVYMDANGDCYLTLLENQETILVKTNSQGNEIWQTTLYNPNTEELRALRWSPDDAFFFTAIYVDEKAQLNKFDASSGTLVFSKMLGTSFSPNSLPSAEEQIRDIIPSTDGGVVAGYQYIVPGLDDFGYEYGKLNASGEVEWWYELAQYYDMDARMMTSDGGYLFTGTRDDSLIAVLKTTSTGEMFPACLDTATVIDLSLELSFFNGLINENTVKALVVNSGIETATGVAVSIPKPGGLFYTPNTPISTSQGTFDAFNTEIWTIGNIAPGDSAYLILPYEQLNSGPQIIFAEIIAAGEGDIDSAPNNGISPIPVEDDEALIIIDVEGEDVIITLTSNGGLGSEAQLYPNPSNGDQINLQWYSQIDTNNRLEVFNALGQKLQSNTLVVEKGPNILPISLVGYAPGIYYLKIQPTGQVLQFVKR